jgi:hypothetical protein
MWSQAGATAGCEAAGVWYAALPKREWPDDAETRAQIKSDWAEPWGDRRQEIVFIGAGMREAALRAALDAALLTDAEMARNARTWARFEDPFPVWTDDAEASS